MMVGHCSPECLVAVGHHNALVTACDREVTVPSVHRYKGRTLLLVSAKWISDPPPQVLTSRSSAKNSGKAGKASGGTRRTMAIGSLFCASPLAAISYPAFSAISNSSPPLRSKPRPPRYLPMPSSRSWPVHRGFLRNSAMTNMSWSQPAFVGNFVTGAPTLRSPAVWTAKCAVRTTMELQVGQRVRVAKPIIMYHYPGKKNQPVEVEGFEGVVCKDVSHYEDVPMSATAPYVVDFSETHKKFSAHFHESELEVL